MTFAPSRAKARAIAKPMLWVEPVTNAILSLRAAFRVLRRLWIRVVGTVKVTAVQWEPLRTVPGGKRKNFIKMVSRTLTARRGSLPKPSSTIIRPAKSFRFFCGSWDRISLNEELPGVPQSNGRRDFAKSPSKTHRSPHPRHRRVIAT